MGVDPVKTLFGAVYLSDGFRYGKGAPPSLASPPVKSPSACVRSGRSEEPNLLNDSLIWRCLHQIASFSHQHHRCQAIFFNNKSLLIFSSSEALTCKRKT